MARGVPDRTTVCFFDKLQVPLIKLVLCITKAPVLFRESRSLTGALCSLRKRRNSATHILRPPSGAAGGARGVTTDPGSIPGCVTAV